jgi:arginyl-tRNA synthetase
MIQKILKEYITQALETLSLEGEVLLEHPTELSHGDFSSNIALSLSKKVGKNPLELAQEITDAFEYLKTPEVASVEIAGPGFINITLTSEFFAQSVGEIEKAGEDFGKNDSLKGEKIIMDYTDPNIFKVFHIGHLMSNIIGQATSNIFEWNGAEVVRCNYQGDVGLHIAKALWGVKKLIKDMPEEDASLSEKAAFLGRAYVEGAKAYEEGSEDEIKELNKVIFDKSDEEINALYEKGREWSLAHFEEVYIKLGTKFDHYLFESETAPLGQKIVEENIGKVFKENDGAVIFEGEEYGLHTRVFINSQGLPTYEAKDLGLIELKKSVCDFDKAYAVAASEQDTYFKVVFKAHELLGNEHQGSVGHISHGMMLNADGSKMSSRKGVVVTGESLIKDIEEIVQEKMKDREGDQEIVSRVAVGALKYSILRQAPGKNIHFDFDTSISFDGDSGPYLQYALVRANKLLKDAGDLGEVSRGDHEMVGLERHLYRFPEVVSSAYTELAPQHVVTYLTELASLFNGFYANFPILKEEDEVLRAYRLHLTKAFKTVMTNGLSVLGVKVPDRM